MAKGYGSVKQSRDGVFGDELEFDFWEEGLPSRIQSQLEYLWQFIPVRDYSNAKRMLAGTGWHSKTCVTWKAEKAVHYFVHTDKVTTDSFTA